MTQNKERKQVKSIALTLLVATSMLLVVVGGFTYTGTATTKEFGGNLVAGVYKAPETTNPLQATEDSWIMGLLYDSLAVYKPTEGILPWLADSWTVGSDNVTVTVKLKSGVTFTDGSPLTSADVVYSYNQYMAGSGIYHDYVSPIQSVSAVDDMTVQFVLKEPNSEFFTKSLMVPIIKDGSANSPVGTGPFMGYEHGTMTGTDTNITLNDPTNPATRKGGDNVTFTLPHTDVQSVTIHIYGPVMYNGSFQRTNWKNETILSSSDYDLDGQNGVITIHHMSEFDYVTVDFTFTAPTITINANTHYFMGRPYVDSVTFVISGTDKAMVDDLNNGRIDVILENIDAYYKSQVQGANIVKPVTTKTVEMVFNCANAPLNNSDFRKAISYSVDKDFFVSKTLQNSGIKGDSIIPRDNLFWYNTSLPARPFDKSMAMSILTKGGFSDKDGDGFVDLPDGTPISLTIKSVGITEVNYLAAEAQTLETVLQSVGINVTWVQEDGANISADMNNGNFDMIMTQFNYPLDPSYLNNFVTGNANNFMHYSNPAFDSVMEKVKTAKTVEDLQKYVKEAQGVLYDDTAVVVLAYLTGLQYYNGEKYEGFQAMINGVNNKFTFLNVYHTISGNLDMTVIPSSTSVNSNGKMTITVTVTDGANPVEGAKVVVSASSGGLSSSELTTDANGMAKITFTAPVVDEPTDVSLTISAYKPGYVHASKSISVTVHPEELPSLSVSIEKGYEEIGSGNSTQITVTVTSGGQPVSGANIEVRVEPSITGANVTVSGPTNENGQAVITFKAPKVTDDISYTLTVVAHKAGYKDSNPNAPSSTMTLLVKGQPASQPQTVKKDTVPGFEAVTALLALSMAGIAFALYRKRE